LEPQQKGIDMKNKEIIVVDDESMITQMLSGFLKELGFTVKAFNDGPESLGYYSRSWREVGAVILDYSMPGMNGQEVGEGMLEVNPEARIIMLSGNVFDIPRDFHRRVFGLLEKPVGMGTLLSALKRAMD